MSNKEYYHYWNKKRDKNYKLLDREKRSLKIINDLSKDKKLNFVDLGCGNGELLLALKKINPNLKLRGFDFSKIEVKEAKGKGLDISFADFSKSIPLDDKSVDIAYAGEVIEHLYDPDLFLSEINRILKIAGYVLITTPNLLAWFNRILFPMGIQPLFLEPSTKSKLVGAGFLKKLKKEPQPVGHIRIFTLQAMRDLMEMNGFRVLNIGGAVYDAGLPKIIWPIDRLFANVNFLSSHMVVLAKKIK